MSDKLVDARCKEHEEGPPCFPCAVHSFLIGQEAERGRILLLLKGKLRMTRDMESTDYNRIVDDIIRDIKKDI